MKIEAVILENFRRYRGRNRILISEFTTIIGRNDAGKSTILEALDIFFGGSTKLDKDDLSRGADGDEIKIGVVFSGFPEELTIDRGAITTLANEHLLNEGGQLEIHKTYNTRPARVTTKVSACALHPSLGVVSNLLALKNTDLKALVRERDLAAACDLNNNPSMRRALYDAHAHELAPILTDVSLTEGDGAGLWKAIERYLPIYTLFKSDRVSTDQDPEAQNPMKAAVARAVADLSDELEDMADRVRTMVEETARRTIEQMQASYPDMRLANELTPKFQEPKWSSIFKIDLSADDGIPLNKRGSGVRRLILMSFFQSEANRLRAERDAKGENTVPIIYAVEEPETSQHPDNQARIVEALQAVVAAGDQVLITTHNPSLAELLPIESIRFVDDEPDTDHVRVRIADDTVLAEVVETLGVLPASVPSTGIKVAVLTEGKTDIDALLNLYDVLTASGDIEPFDLNAVFWAMGGGSTVKDWIERKYLDKLNIPQVVIVDSDRDGKSAPESRKIKELMAMIVDPKETTFFSTNKREIENYLHPDVLVRVSNGTLSFDAAWDMDYDRLPTRLGDVITAARKKGKIEFEPVTKDGEPMHKLETSSGHCKRVITSYLFANMTADEIKERSISDDGTCEVTKWLEAIGQHVK
ncbi:ATP-binding protein [Rhodovulum sulfidophilum]|uniref:ATP-binding protein n=1 Tax=Rhodovulum sulfidophilum TaxID=35806 RepID=UPI001922081A|nr:ATP-binding protein [Rhodovulum sulfidophilum]MBL3575665.1 ATP-binding protein [Rhodovulum sulfidophilum]MCE8432042.1 ATP-binding protein [Rhodovulum sulfidophilum]MCF4118584.1 ATP-binding protein [Rhodovulum sulfidophilum]